MTPHDYGFWFRTTVTEELISHPTDQFNFWQVHYNGLFVYFLHLTKTDDPVAWCATVDTKDGRAVAFTQRTREKAITEALVYIKWKVEKVSDTI